MERVGALLRGLEGQAVLRRRLAEARAIEKWPELVGPHLAKRTRPLRVAGERLFVMAPGAALRQELTFHKRTILRKFNGAAGPAAVREIVFVESDALSRPEAPEVQVTQARPEAAGGVVVEESVARRAMHEEFDAEAYRRELAGIATGRGVQSVPPRRGG